MDQVTAAQEVASPLGGSLNLSGVNNPTEWLMTIPVLPGSLPGLLPNLLATVVIGIVVGGLAAHRVGLPKRWLGALWAICLLAPLAYTFTRNPSGGLNGCELGLLPWESSTALLANETRVNVLLFVPAGAAAMLFPAGPAQLRALLLALATPPMVELGQMLVPPLGRACQVSDVVNNCVGVLLGFFVAAGVVAVWRSWTNSYGPDISAEKSNLRLGVRQK